MAGEDAGAEEKKKDEIDDPFKYKPPTFLDRMGELFIFFSIINAIIVATMEKPYDLTERFAIYGLVEAVIFVVATLGGALTNAAPPVPEGVVETLKDIREAKKGVEVKGVEPKGLDKERAA